MALLSKIKVRFAAMTRYYLEFKSTVIKPSDGKNESISTCQHAADFHYDAFILFRNELILFWIYFKILISECQT